MSKVIASVAISGAYKIVEKAEAKWKTAMDQWGANEPIGFPNTAYYLPVIYGMLGYKVEKLGDIEFVLKKCRALLPPPVKEIHPLPYLGNALDAGMAAFFAEEIIEAIRYRENPRYYVSGEDVTPDNIWLGAADDVILRKRGTEFVDGTAPGFAAILGAAPTPQIAANIAHELQQKKPLCFYVRRKRRQTFRGTIGRSRRPSRLGHTARAFWPRCQRHSVRAGFCHPGGHVFRRHRTRGLPQTAVV
jgi:acetyl-CoA synthase